jgi:phosphoribosylformylglycinamidine synthase
MMPHPERSYLKWQWPYLTPDISKHPVSPWIRMFQNAREFCGNR